MPQISRDELRKQIEAIENALCAIPGMTDEYNDLEAALSRARELMRESPIAAEVRALYPDAPDTKPDTTRQALNAAIAANENPLDPDVRMARRIVAADLARKALSEMEKK